VAHSLPEEASSDATTDSVPLVQQLDGRRIRVTPAGVALRVVFQPQQQLYELTDVPVQFLCPANFPLRALFTEESAGKITLHLMGPAGEDPPAVSAFIDLCGRQWEPGVHEEPLRIHLPTNFRLAQDLPRRLPFELTPFVPENKRAAK